MPQVASNVQLFVGHYTSETGFFNGVIGSVLAVPVLLFFNGYYLTRALAGVAWRSGNQWLYPLLAAAIFVGHVYFAVKNSTGSFTPLARATVVPFLTGGACIVFTCALAGNWLFRKWTRGGGASASAWGYTQ